MTDYIKYNKDTWNKKTPVHLASAFYDMDSFLHGRNSLTSVELELLGEVKGLSILHLQCHFGQDTLSLSRMGAKATGIDLSDVAINKAKELNDQLGLDAEFICCDVYETPSHVEKQFDVVYSSFGAIGWLPDMEKWAEVIARMLKPGGKFVFAEFHPAVWMFDDDFTKIAYDYFNTGPLIETSHGTYTDREAPIETTSVFWNHSFSEVLSALIKNDLILTSFNEYPYSPFNCFNDLEEKEQGKYTLKKLDKQFPYFYALTMLKK